MLKGRARLAGPARFAVVAGLGRSVEALAERFRVFAAAQERALTAKAASRRMKQLLFASVSHDLKSPLNAILGFAELVRDEPLSPSQRESLDMVAGRGRELLVLIETILDAARVEAGQLQLMPTAVDVDDLIADALSKARDLSGERQLEVIVEMARGIPPLNVDRTYASRAVGVLISHAMDTGTAVRGRAIRVRGSLPARQQYDGFTMARIDIEYVASSNRPSVLEAQLAGKIPSSTRSRSDPPPVARTRDHRAASRRRGGRTRAARRGGRHMLVADRHRSASRDRRCADARHAHATTRVRSTCTHRQPSGDQNRGDEEASRLSRSSIASASIDRS